MSGAVLIDQKLEDTLLVDENDETKSVADAGSEEEINWILLKLHLEVFHTLSR